MKQICNRILILHRISLIRLLLYFASFLFVNGFFVTTTSNSQEREDISATLLQEKAVKVFLDVSRRYHDYIKTEIPFVNYVRDRKQAQVYIMMTSQRTGAGGNEYTIKLIGQKNFENVNDTLKYVSKQMDTEEMTRSGIVKVLKKGLIRYVEKTPLADYITISYRRVTKPTDVIDKWNYWVFVIDLDTDISGEKSRKEFSLDGSFSADRVTPDLKVSLSVGSDYNRDKYETEEGWYTSISRSRDFRGLIVKSLSEHWSMGMYGSANASTYLNTKFSVDVAPAIEYNVFPYSDYTRREFRLLYRAAYNNIHYEEETIFDKTHEHLFYEKLSATFELKERWGSLSSTLEGSHYFHDFSKYNLQLSCNLNLRLFEGLSLNIFGRVSMIRDQLSLSKRGATEKEILLHRKQIATDYDFFTSIGFRYTFGSIYSNVVNPRFGSSRRRGRRGGGHW